VGDYELPYLVVAIARVSFLLPAKEFHGLLKKNECSIKLGHRSADALIERYQAGKRDVNGWNLSKEDLSGAILSAANLRRAKATQKQLDQASTLKGATMPDGTVHE
jgi:uncharacterized protein YjbI with pentapeptide repeats